MNETDNELVVINSEEEAILSLQKLESNARAMLRLQENEDFKLLFENGFIKDWAVTQTNNMSVYHPERRVRVMENMLARSIFKQYCEDIIDKGRSAIETLKQIEEDNFGVDPEVEPEEA